MSHVSLPLDVEQVRSSFPALERLDNGRVAAYLDGAGGTQVPRQVIDAMSGVLTEGMSNLGGGFASSATTLSAAGGPCRTSSTATLRRSRSART